MRAFITGIAGFAGSHLAEYLLAQGEVQVGGLVHDRLDNIAHLRDRLLLRNGDLLDAAGLTHLLVELRPDHIYHLAGQAFVASSWLRPWDTFEANVRGQLNLLEAVRLAVPDTRILVVGSNEEYGQVQPENLPIDEFAPLRPDSPYGVSKVAQDLMGLQYHLSYNLNTVRVRAFNHIGPRQTDRFVASSFARQVAEIEAGLQLPVIKVGNLTAQRDFTDVRDTVRAYALVLRHGDPGEVYNVGSGTSHSIQDLLDSLLKLARVDVRVEVDQSRLRPSDTPVSYCNYTKLFECTGWQPSVSFRQGLQDTLDYWRTKVGEGVKKAS